MLTPLRSMSRTRLALLTTIAMLAFAGNSMLCRLALKGTSIDAATFTAVRVLSAALVLWLLVRGKQRGAAIGGSWNSALALFIYAAAFSFAYVRLPAGPGALLLFGAVQGMMIGCGLWAGQRLGSQQWAGLLLAVAGLIWLVLPGMAAPPLSSSLLMLAAGGAWGVYSLRGVGSSDPVATTAGNFLRAAPFAAVLGLPALAHPAPDRWGCACAVLSGALTSGLGYIVWYAAVKALKPATAASVQLSVPVIAALGGTLLLDEPLTARLVTSSVAILGGIALVIAGKR